MGKGCAEKIDWKFLKWIQTYPDSKRPEILNKINAYKSNKNVIVLHNTKEVKQFLKQLA